MTFYRAVHPEDAITQRVNIHDHFIKLEHQKLQGIDCRLVRYLWKSCAVTSVYHNLKYDTLCLCK